MKPYTVYTVFRRLREAVREILSYLYITQPIQKGTGLENFFPRASSQDGAGADEFSDFGPGRNSNKRFSGSRRLQKSLLRPNIAFSEFLQSNTVRSFLTGYCTDGEKPIDSRRKNTFATYNEKSTYKVKRPFSLWRGGEHLDDRQIIDLYFKRSERAIQETEAKYGKLCLRIARNILTFLRTEKADARNVFIRKYWFYNAV